MIDFYFAGDSNGVELFTDAMPLTWQEMQGGKARPKTGPKSGRGEVDSESFYCLLDMVKLNERQRDVVFLYYFCGMTYKQIGEKLGVSNITVGARIRTVKAKILNLFQI